MKDKKPDLTPQELLMAMLSSGCVKLNPIEIDIANEYPFAAGVKTAGSHKEVQENLEIIRELYDLIWNYWRTGYVHQRPEERCE